MMLGFAGAVGEFMELLAEAAVESGLEIAASAALGVGVAVSVYVLGRKVSRKRRLPADRAEG